jgi:hypothetical protein
MNRTLGFDRRGAGGRPPPGGGDEAYSTTELERVRWLSPMQNSDSVYWLSLLFAAVIWTWLLYRRHLRQKAVGIGAVR